MELVFWRIDWQMLFGVWAVTFPPPALFVFFFKYALSYYLNFGAFPYEGKEYVWGFFVLGVVFFLVQIGMACSRS